MDYKSLIGKTVRLNHVNNSDGYDDSRFNGKTGKVVYVDDMNQIHLEGCGIAIIPERDDWEILD
jgi:hypothetical protein